MPERIRIAGGGDIGLRSQDLGATQDLPEWSQHSIISGSDGSGAEDLPVDINEVDFSDYEENLERDGDTHIVHDTPPRPPRPYVEDEEIPARSPVDQAVDATDGEICEEDSPNEEENQKRRAGDMETDENDQDSYRRRAASVNARSHYAFKGLRTALQAAGLDEETDLSVLVEDENELNEILEDEVLANNAAMLLQSEEGDELSPEPIDTTSRNTAQPDTTDIAGLHTTPPPRSQQQQPHTKRQTTTPRSSPPKGPSRSQQNPSVIPAPPPHHSSVPPSHGGTQGKTLEPLEPNQEAPQTTPFVDLSDLSTPPDSEPSTPEPFDSDSEGSDDFSDFNDNDGEFDYERPRERMSIKELGVASYYDIQSSGSGIRRRTDIKIRRFIKSISQRWSLLVARLQVTPQNKADHAMMKETLKLKTAEIRSARTTIMAITGIVVTQKHRCSGNCEAYIGDQEECGICGESRYKIVRGETVPRATFPYIELKHRLKLWYSDPVRARSLVEYRRFVQQKYRRYGINSDFFSGSMFREYIQKEKGLFKNEHDIALLCSLDKFRRYGQWSPRLKRNELTPILVLCYNLPPRIRFLNRNMLLVGFIPGGPQPIEVDTFLHPLVEEVRRLERGTNAYDGYTGNQFLLSAFLCVIATDMIEKALVFHLMGNRGRRYCEVCMITSLYLNKSSVYCCHRSPLDAPLASINRERVREESGHLAFFKYGAEGDEERLNPEFRDMEHFNRVYRYLETHRYDQKYQRLYGLKARPIFMKLKTICLPWSFSLDIMHLLSNCSKDMTKHFNGSFGKKPRRKTPYMQDEEAEAEEAEEREAERDIEEEPDAEPEEEPPEPGAAAAAAQQPVDEYIIPPHEWARIAADQEASRKTFPPSIGNVVLITSGNLTTADWFTWTLHQSPIYLSGLLPDVHLRGYILFVRAFKMTLKKEYSNDEMDELELLFKQFSQYYEEQIYKLQYDRLKKCLPVCHAILHIAEYIRRIGPLYASSQFPMERVIRIVKLMLMSTTAPNENCANRMVDNEMLNLLAFIAPLPPGVGKGFHNLLETDKFSDSEGRFDIGRLFQFAMREDIEEYCREDAAEHVWPTLKVDEPWTPVGFQHAPRRGRPLPNGRGDDEDEDTSDEEDEGPDVSVVDTNFALKDINEEPLSTREKDHIIQWLRTRALLPEFATVTERRNFIDTLSPVKYKTLVIAKKEAAIADPIAYTVDRVTGSQAMDTRAFFSYANIHYRHQDGQNRISQKYGEVFFFFSMKHPLRRNTRQTLDLAYVKRIPHLLSRNKLFVELKKPRTSNGIDIIPMRWVESVVGILTCRGTEYIVWPDGCIAEPGRF